MENTVYIIIVRKVEEEKYNFVVVHYNMTQVSKCAVRVIKVESDRRRQVIKSRR